MGVGGLGLGGLVLWFGVWGLGIRILIQSRGGRGYLQRRVVHVQAAREVRDDGGLSVGDCALGFQRDGAGRDSVPEMPLARRPAHFFLRRKGVELGG